MKISDKTVSLFSFRKFAILLLLFSIILLSAGCKKGVTPSVSFPEASSGAASSSVSNSVSSEISEVAKPQDMFSSLSLPSAELPLLCDDLQDELLRDDELTAFLDTYDGSFPVICDVVCANGECYAYVVYEATWLDAESYYRIKGCWLSIDTKNGSFGDRIAEAPVSDVYDKNANNQNGYFWIDYEPVSSGTACPYVLLYHENGEDRTLHFEEEAKVYARIIRQNDFYAVLSILEGSERHYWVIDREGKTISELEWVSDISTVSPLMFDENLLYCKVDSDEDFVYDTIGAIELKSGEYQEILHVGNSDYWTYFADGRGIAVYGSDTSNANTVQYYSTLENKLYLFSLESSIVKLDTIDGYLYGITQDASSYAFVWDVAEQKLFESEPHSAECDFVFGKGIFAAFDEKTVTVYYH